MHFQFGQERRDLDLVDASQETHILKEQTTHFNDRARDGLRRLAQTSGQFTSAVGHMKRQVLGLSSTRMMCKIEGARLGRQADGLAEIINQLDKFQSEIEKRLNRIDSLNRDIKRHADALANSGGQGQNRVYQLYTDETAA